METIRIHNYAVTYEKNVSEKERTVLFLHGAGGSRAAWSYQYEVFSELTTTIFLDLPGHGNSQGRPLMSIKEYAEWLATVIDSLSLQKPIIAGHSMGSAIALQFALDFPVVPGGLILVGAGAKLRVAPVILDLISSDFNRACDMIASNLFNKKELDGYFKRIQEDMQTCGSDGLLVDFTACDAFNVIDRIQSLTLPVLAIVGERDVMTPPKYSQFFEASLPDCELHIIGGAGHMVMAEEPEPFNEVVSGFIENKF